MKISEKVKSGESLTVHVGLVINKTLWGKIRRLAKKHRVSAAFIVDRALVAVTESGQIYWPTGKELEEQAREKFGEAAVPTFDGQSEAPSEEAEKVKTSSRAQ